MPSSEIVVTELWLYPIKSCAGIPLAEATLGPRGIMHDREWMIVQPDGKFLTQREYPALAVVAPRIEGEWLWLDAPGMERIGVPLYGDGDAMEVVVWRDTCTARDQGAEIAAWLSTYLGIDCRLVRFADDWTRQVDLTFAQAGDQVGFADAYPFLLTSESSLADLNGRLAQPVPMNRFRPNIVVTGDAAYAEDGWRRVSIGDVPFRVAKPCARCVTTTVDQRRGVKDGPEPLATLSTYRRQERGAMFGQNLVHDQLGILRVGDRLVIEEPGAPA